MNTFGKELVPNRNCESWTIEDWREACRILMANRDYHAARANKLHAENKRLTLRRLKVDTLPLTASEQDYDEPRLRGSYLDKAAKAVRYFVGVVSPLRKHGFRRKPFNCGYAADAESADACAIEAWCRIVESQTGHSIAEILRTPGRVTPSFKLRFPLLRESHGQQR